MPVSTIFIILLTVVTCHADHVARINENGAITAGPVTDHIIADWISPESNVTNERNIFVGQHTQIFSYSPDLTYVASVSGIVGGVTIDDVRNSIYISNYESGRYGDHTYLVRVLDYDFNEKYSFEVPAVPISLSVDESNAGVWVSTFCGENDGLHKYNENGEETLFVPESYGVRRLGRTDVTGSVWASYVLGTELILKRHDSNGNVIVEIEKLFDNFEFGEVWGNDGSIWLIVGHGANTEVYKLNSVGSITARYSGMDNICSLTVNQANGSVWLTNNRGEIVRLNSDGQEELRLRWFEDQVLGAIGDPSDNSAIVFSQFNWGESIQPSSLGEIKAMFK
ncbi:MAG: hypothetical protein JSW52_12215 [Candidatus Coatesbacteria bacterium]|nr:MAG: hypothetical protein JSW52_12215 [Candidatus Coatesbacteria bacterium]